jgi:hypothetical protein
VTEASFLTHTWNVYEATAGGTQLNADAAFQSATIVQVDPL